MSMIFKIAICQMNVINNKQDNISCALSNIHEAAKNKADIVVLPEMFNCPYENSQFTQYAEAREDSPTLKALSGCARDLGVYIVGGSIPEFDDGNIYNTSFVFNRMGDIIARHRKVHLFNIDVPGGITFRESDILNAGGEVTVFETEYGKIGLAICFDIRFPELFRLMVLKGAGLIIVPAAFNMVTGPAHWEVLIRARAVDNQLYVAAASPARDENANYIAYGNSIVADPWGKVTARAGAGMEILYSDIDPNYVESVRKQLPVLSGLRSDIYRLI